MAIANYLHGIRVTKSNNEVRIVLTPNQAVIGIVGVTTHSGSSLDFDLPIVFFRRELALSAIRPDETKKDEGFLFHAVRSLFNQGASTVVIVRAKSASDADISNAIEKLLEAEAITNYKPKIIIAPGHTGKIPKSVSPSPAPTPSPTPSPSPTPTPSPSPRS